MKCPFKSCVVIMEVLTEVEALNPNPRDWGNSAICHRTCQWLPDAPPMHGCAHQVWTGAVNSPNLAVLAIIII